MKREFDLEWQWKKYLERVRVKEEDMPAIQKQETKRAFMGACGQMLIMLRDDVGELDEQGAIEMFKNLLDQVEVFWLGEVKSDFENQRPK